MANRDQPWRVSMKEFKELDITPNTELIAIAKQLSRKLGRSTGHKEASLYLAWTHKKGIKGVNAWWKKNTPSN